MIGGDGMAESFLTLMAEYGDADQKKISLWYDALQDAGFRGTQTRDLRHHISLATFPLDQEAEAVRLMQDVAGRFAPRQADIRHMGVMPGGKVLFAAPDMHPSLTALKKACGTDPVGGYPWLPHTTLLIDTPDTVADALKVLVKHFAPITAQITALRLCAFWPKREIAWAKLTGEE